MTVRLKDIANDLNLSKMTISKVLRGQTDVSAATKARVLQRMKELNYRPNIPARSLRTGNTFTIGLVIPSLTSPFFADVARTQLAVQPHFFFLFLLAVLGLVILNPVTAIAQIDTGAVAGMTHERFRWLVNSTSDI